MGIADTLLTLLSLSAQDVLRSFVTVLVYGGWVIFLVVFFIILFQVYMRIIQERFLNSLSWVFLRVRVPEANLRTPRSMEEVFNALHGLLKAPDLMEKYLDGYVQNWLSLEIRGTHEGVQLLLRVPEGNRDMVEASIYAQYPDADIDEVSDYTDPYGVDDIGKDFDIWGVEMTLTKKDTYPIKTYVDFEDQFAEEGRLVDTMSTITELFGILKPGEEAWIQILIRPVFRDDWQKAGMAEALKLAGRETPKTPTAAEQAFQLLSRAITVAITLAPAPAAAAKKKEDNFGVLKLTPGETDVVRAIQRNISKVAYETKIRIAYVAPPPAFNKRGRVPLLFGLFRQFGAGNLNGFRPDGRTSTSKPTYAFVRSRQARLKHRLLRKYKERAFYMSKGFVLNVEEIATLYHFPVEYTKAPSLERTTAKRGEAPTNLPLAPEDLPLA